MDIRRLPTLDPYISRCLGDPGLDAEERAKVDNVVFDERPPMAGVEISGGPGAIRPRPPG